MEGFKNYFDIILENLFFSYSKSITEHNLFLIDQKKRNLDLGSKRLDFSEIISKLTKKIIDDSAVESFVNNLPLVQIFFFLLL